MNPLFLGCLAASYNNADSHFAIGMHVSKQASTHVKAGSHFVTGLQVSKQVKAPSPAEQQQMIP
jgi:hypothetical protein